MNPEAGRHSFIVRIWLEERTDEGDAHWRGHATHLPSGTRRHFERLKDLTAFIQPYLTWRLPPPPSD